MAKPLTTMISRHHQHRRVRDALRSVVLALRWQFLLEMEVVEDDVLCLSGGVAVGEDVTPLLGCEEIGGVDRTVDDEQPAEREVECHAARQASIEFERLVDGVGEEHEPLPAADAEGVHVLGPVDPQPAPDHDHQQREVDPVQPADRPGVHEPGDRFVTRSLVVDDGVGRGLGRHAGDRTSARTVGRSRRGSVSCPFPDVSRSDTVGRPQR